MCPGASKVREDDMMIGLLFGPEMLISWGLAVAYKEISMTTLPHPFVNPVDTFSQLKLPGAGES
jgi:hypothetical protein